MPIPLLAGMLYAAAGYKSHQNGERARERQDKEDARRAVVEGQSDAKHNALMAQEAERVAEAQRIKSNRDSDAKAFAPVSQDEVTAQLAGPNVDHPDVAGDPLMQGLAAKEAQKQSTMSARTQRLSDNQAATGRVADSMKTMDMQVGRNRDDEAYAQQQAAVAKRVKEEGLIEAAQAARRGDPKAVFEAFNTGSTRLDAEPTVQKIQRTLPGYGVIDDYIYSGTTTGPDGKKVPFQKSAHDLSMQVMPYEKQLQSLNKGEETANRGALQAAQAEAATMRALLAGSRGGSGGGGTSQAQAPTGFNMDALDKQLMPWFTTKDEATGKTAVNTVALNDLRQLALRTPAAQSGDVNGAAFQVKNLYDVYMAKTGNDHNKAMALLQQDSAPKPAEEAKPQTAPAAKPAPKATAQSAPSGTTSMQQAYDNWQAIKSENTNWYGGKKTTPGSAEREAAAEAAYLKLLRNPK
jgi:hypothetical protein